MKETTLPFPTENAGKNSANLVISFLKSSSQDITINSLNDYFQKLPTLEKLKKILGLSFKSPIILMEAMTHKSFVHQFIDIQVPSNEKLEFLGDSILGAIVSHNLVLKYPQLNEGELSRFRGALVNENSLAALSRSINLGECILFGQGEINSGGIDKDGPLSDAFEALLGAVYFDRGYEAAISFFQTLLDVYQEREGQPFIRIDRLNHFDGKSRLQEKVMALYKELPEYFSENVENQKFKVRVKIKGQILAEGVSISKKKMERELATKILEEKLYLNL